MAAAPRTSGDATGMAWLARRDGSVLVGYGPFVSSTEMPTGGVAFYKQAFTADKEGWWQVPASFERLPVDEFQARYAKEDAPTVYWETPDAMPFSIVFQEVTDRIRQGMIEKTVPVVVEKGSFGSGGVNGIVGAMIRRKAPLQSYGWIDGDRGFAGATPELLFSLSGLRLETMALAGTAKRDDEEVFGVDEKEIREHEYVAQTLVAKLLDLGSLKRREREILRLGSIVHFLTCISVDLENSLEPRRLMQRLHPTPALGPLPRTDQTMAILGEWRERLGCPAEFGAPFGVWDEGKFEAIVAIRGIWWDRDKALLPAGCGVIEASRLVNEWRELRLKREAVKAFLRDEPDA